MSAKISMMLSLMPQFKNFSKCEVDGAPLNEQQFLASVRIYKRAAEGASVLVSPSDNITLLAESSSVSFTPFAVVVASEM